MVDTHQSARLGSFGIGQRQCADAQSWVRPRSMVWSKNGAQALVNQGDEAVNHINMRI
jgi:hypothetical protein